MDSHNFIEDNVFPVPERGTPLLLIVLGVVVVLGFFLVGHWDYQIITSESYQTFTQ